MASIQQKSTTRQVGPSEPSSCTTLKRWVYVGSDAWVCSTSGQRQKWASNDYYVCLYTHIHSSHYWLTWCCALRYFPSVGSGAWVYVGSGAWVSVGSGAWVYVGSGALVSVGSGACVCVGYGAWVSVCSGAWVYVGSGACVCVGYGLKEQVFSVSWLDIIWMSKSGSVCLFF